MKHILVALCFYLPFALSEYELGIGIADVTGPIVGITLLGYGNMQQQGTGLHLRQWARAFIIKKETSRMVFVNVDCAMMSDGVRIEVIERLQKKYKDLYNLDNVMISATHSHSGVGGYMKHSLFDLPSFGFSPETFEAMVTGIVESIEMAHQRMETGELIFQRGYVANANINRSPTSYLANPQEERDKYTDNVDKDLNQLQFWSSSGKPMGVINWFAVHATSMNNTNTLISSDNVGFASMLFEEKMNPGKIPGKGPFIAAFASSNLGDVSPNIMGPLCHPSGSKCGSDGTCPSLFDSCFALGPGVDMFESTRIIGERIFSTAWEIWQKPNGVKVVGPVRSIHQYVNMTTAKVEVWDQLENRTIMGNGCRPAMGYSFSSGTTDGPFVSYIVPQGTKKSTTIINTVRNILGKPTKEDDECHFPKPIILYTGGMTFPYDWQPWVVSSQVALVGQLAILGVPGEFTTMAGRRMRSTVAAAAGPGTISILAGLSNTYSDYITTFEEYQTEQEFMYRMAFTCDTDIPATSNPPESHKVAAFNAMAHRLFNVLLSKSNYLMKVISKHEKKALLKPVYSVNPDEAQDNMKYVQRYEGASTLFGPHTHAIHMEQFKKLTHAMVNGEKLERGPEPRGIREQRGSLVPPQLPDFPGLSGRFGNVILQPSRHVIPGDVVTASFVAGHPSRSLMIRDTFLTVEYETSPGIWQVIATDANWETRFHWKRKFSIFGTATVEYYVPLTAKAGHYRIRHFGHYRDLSMQVFPYDGTTENFEVSKTICLAQTWGKLLLEFMRTKSTKSLKHFNPLLTLGGQLLKYAIYSLSFL